MAVSFPLILNGLGLPCFFGNCAETGSNVVVASLGGSTTTNANQTTEKFSKSLIQYANFWITALNYEQALKI